MTDVFIMREQNQGCQHRKKRPSEDTVRRWLSTSEETSEEITSTQPWCLTSSHLTCDKFVVWGLHMYYIEQQLFNSFTRTHSETHRPRFRTASWLLVAYSFHALLFWHFQRSSILGLISQLLILPLWQLAFVTASSQWSLLPGFIPLQVSSHSESRSEL